MGKEQGVMSTPSATGTADAIGHGDHACGVFGSDAEAEAALAGFVADGLAARDRVWCLSHAIPPGDILAGLVRAGIEVDGALESGQLAIRSAGDSYLSCLPFDPARMVTSLHEAVDQALADGWAGFRVTGDMGWATRDLPGADRLFDYEARVGEVFATRPAAALCCYDRRVFDAHGLEVATALHASPVGGAEGRLEVLALPATGGLALVGDVDISTWDALEAALGPFRRGDGDVHLELGALRFIDMRGARLLAGFAGGLPRGRSVVLHHPPGVLRRMLELAWGETPGLEVAGS